MSSFKYNLNGKIGGRFNSQLKKTGFLSEIKKSSKLISKDPKRFLEDFANNNNNNLKEENEEEEEEEEKWQQNSSSSRLETSCLELESFIDKLQTKKYFVEKGVEEIKEKHEFMKKRSFLLKMASANIINLEERDLDYLSNTTSSLSSSNPSPAFAAAEKAGGHRPRPRPRPNSEASTTESSRQFDVELLEQMIETYIKQIKVKILDMKDIFQWIISETKMSDLKLPYGLPKALKIPSDPNKLLAENGTTTTTIDESVLEFIESSVDNFLILDGEYHNKLELITTKIHELTRQLTSEEQEYGGGGWNLMDTAILYYITQNQIRIGIHSAPAPAKTKDINRHGPGGPGSTTSNSVQTELLTRIFPTKSQESIIQQKYIIKYKKMYLEKVESILNDWFHDKNELTAKINSAWKELNKKYLTKIETKVKIKQQQELCKYWSNIVEQLRKEKCIKIKTLELLLEPLKIKAEEELRHQKELEIKRRENIQENLIKYKSHKEQLKMQAFLEKEEEKELLEEMKKIRQKINRPKIEFRHEKRRMKDKARAEAKEIKRHELLARAAKLESIKEPVQIDYEPWNVINDTHASAVRRYETLKQFEESDDTDSKLNEQVYKFFHQYYSFTTEKILKDRRVRLEMKLRDAGLLESSYARQVLKAMEPKPKPHLLGQIKFDDH